MMPDRLLAVSIVARRLDVGADTVRQWIRQGKIAYVRTSTGRYRVPASELARLLALQKSVISATLPVRF